MKTPFERPAIYLITEGRSTAQNYPESSRQIIEIVRTAVDCGVSMVQVREKHLSTKLLFSLVSDAAAITAGSKTVLLVNDRADVPMAAGADGVHLTSSSLSANTVRTFLGQDKLIGVSTHSASEATSAAAGGADFVVFGPIFETPGKADVIGIDELTRVCSLLDPFPVIALGGINESNYQNVLDAGSAGFAAIRSLNDADGLRKISSALLQSQH